MSNLKTVVYQRLEAIANSEKITRAELMELSRELLLYVPESNDIEIVNRLLGVLTPMNRSLSILYFKHFLPWEAEEDKQGNFSRFGKMFRGENKIAKRMSAISEWLADETNNIWTWGEDNVEIKQKDFKAQVVKAIKKALQGDKKTDTPALTKAEVVMAIFDGGVSIDDLLNGIQVQERILAAREQAEQVEKELLAA